MHVPLLQLNQAPLEYFNYKAYKKLRENAITSPLIITQGVSPGKCCDVWKLREQDWLIAMDWSNDKIFSLCKCYLFYIPDVALPKKLRESKIYVI